MRAYTDLDREANQQAIRRFQEAQKQALDEQRLEQRPESQKFRDGRMSDREYQRYEEAQLRHFKENIIKRIAAGSKALSAFDMAQADEFAQQDPEFRALYEEAKERAAGVGRSAARRAENPAPERATEPDEPQQPQAGGSVVQNWPNAAGAPEAASPVQYIERIVPVSAPQQRQPLPVPGQAYLDQTAIIMQQMLNQQQLLLAQMSQPGQQAMQLLLQLQEQRAENERLRDQRQSESAVNGLQAQIAELERRLEDQRADEEQITQIRKLEEERVLLQRQMDQVRRMLPTAKQIVTQDRGQREFSEGGGKYSVKNATTSKGVSLKQLEEWNSARWQALRDIRDKFGLQ